MRLPIPAILAGLTALSAYASALGDAAALLKPGEWAAFGTQAWTTSLITTGVDNILNYSGSGVWDPIGREVRFVGQGHNEPEKMIIYDEAANTWRNSPPPVGTGIGHGYDHNAIDDRTGISYYRKYYSTGVYAYQDRNWSALPSLPGTESDYTCCGALVYSNDLGGLTFWSNGGIYAFRGGKWSTLKTGLPMGTYHNVAEYSKPYGLVIGGGGNGDNRLYALDPKGDVATLPPAPTGIGIYSGLLIADPSSGELLALGDTGAFYAYHPGNRSWKALPKPPARYLESGGSAILMTVAVPIETYGVVMFLHRDGIVLYKHAATGPVPVRPLPAQSAPEKGSPYRLWLSSDRAGLPSGENRIVRSLLGRASPFAGESSRSLPMGVFILSIRR